MHTNAELGEVSKEFYIKGCEVNWDTKSIVSLNEMKCKYIIQYHHVHTMYNFNR